MLLEKYPDMAYQTRMRWGLMPITLSWLTRKFRDANSAKHFNSGLLRFLLLESQVSESNGPANSLTVAPASNATTVAPASNAQATEDLANVLLSAVSAVTGNFDSSSKMNIHGDVNTKTEYNTTNNNYHSAGINKETLQGMFDSQTQEVERMVQDSAQDYKDQTQHVAEQVAQTLTAKKQKRSPQAPATPGAVKNLYPPQEQDQAMGNSYPVQGQATPDGVESSYPLQGQATSYDVEDLYSKLEMGVASPKLPQTMEPPPPNGIPFAGSPIGHGDFFSNFP